MADYKRAWLGVVERLREREAEIDRLREALERIANGEYDLHRADSFASEAKEIAREALSRPENERG